MKPKAQIKTQLKQEDGARLDKIIKDYNFRSSYEFVKTILQVFIKAHDPREDELLTENLKEIFVQEVDTKLNRR